MQFCCCYCRAIAAAAAAALYVERTCKFAILSAKPYTYLTQQLNQVVDDDDNRFVIVDNNKTTLFKPCC